MKQKNTETDKQKGTEKGISVQLFPQHNLDISIDVTIHTGVNLTVLNLPFHVCQYQHL